MCNDESQMAGSVPDPKGRCPDEGGVSPALTKPAVQPGSGHQTSLITGGDGCVGQVAVHCGIQEE